MRLFRKYRNIQERSIQYARENTEIVARTNQQTLVLLNTFFFVVVFVYYLASLSVFKDWNVTPLYLTVFCIQAVLEIFVLMRYRTDLRPIREVNFVCAVFEYYAIAFVGIMCIVPVEFEQPAVYFAPILMAFSCSFIFNYYQTIVMALIEIVVYLCFSFYFKPIGVFSVDASSSILAVFMVVFLNRILYDQRAREYEARKKVEQLGMIDEGTGIYNKTSIAFMAKRTIKEDFDAPAIFMILDFDNFKNVNDSYGHAFGDVVLRRFGEILNSEASDQHLAGRVGGDEFCMYLNGISIEDAEKMAKSINEQTRQIAAPDGSTPFSCSIGIASKRTPEDEMNAQNASYIYKDMFKRADEALYYVKNHGKNNYITENELMNQNLVDGY